MQNTLIVPLFKVGANDLQTCVIEEIEALVSSIKPQLIQLSYLSSTLEAAQKHEGRDFDGVKVCAGSNVIHVKPIKEPAEK